MRREYNDIPPAERKLIIKDFKKNYTGEGLIDKWKLSREAFRKLRDESRYTAY